MVAGALRNRGSNPGSPVTPSQKKESLQQKWDVHIAVDERRNRHVQPLSSDSVAGTDQESVKMK